MAEGVVSLERGLVIFLSLEPPAAFMRSDKGKVYGTHNPDYVAMIEKQGITHPIVHVKFEGLHVAGATLALRIWLIEDLQKEEKERIAKEKKRREKMQALRNSHPERKKHSERICKGDTVKDKVASKEEEEEFGLRQLLEKWYGISAMWNKTEYPFPCEGFVISNSDENNNTNTISVFSPRLGLISVPEDPSRQDRPFARFMVVAPGLYRAWQYDNLPKSLISVEARNHLQAKGFAMMALTSGDSGESRWNAWNDALGLMGFISGSANGPGVENWEPTGQVIKFEASSTDKGVSWYIDKFELVDFTEAIHLNLFPKQAYFVDDLQYKKTRKIRGDVTLVEFQSATTGGVVYARFDHVRASPTGRKNLRYSAVVVPMWTSSCLLRQLVGLIVAPTLTWSTHLLYREIAFATDEWAEPNHEWAEPNFK